MIGVYLDDTISPPGNEMRGKGKGGVFRLDEEKCIWYGAATESFRRQNEKENSEEQERQVSSDDMTENQITETEDNSKPTATTTMTAVENDDQVPSEVIPKGLDDIYFQYCISQLDALIFGGSVEHGTNAIRICSDLRTCSCGPSDTYQNLPLVPEETDPFLIGQSSFPSSSSCSQSVVWSYLPSLFLPAEDVEVFCGHMAMEDFIERHSV